MWNNLLARVQNGRFGDVRLWPMRCSFDLYAVYSQTGVMGIRSDRVDLLNTQVTLRGHCTTHVLRDRQLAANHLSTVLSRERGEKIKPLKRFILSGRSRCRGFGWRATAFFSRWNMPLVFSKPGEVGWLLDRNVARQSCRSVDVFSILSFSNPSLYFYRCLHYIWPDYASGVEWPRTAACDWLLPPEPDV